MGGRNALESAWWLTARQLQATDTCDRALDAWQRVITEFPKQWVGYQGVADTLNHHGRHAEADGFVVEHAPIVCR
jgi:hypothetical protein